MERRQNRRKTGTRLKMTDSNSYDPVIGSESETDGERTFLREEKDDLTKSHIILTCSETTLKILYA